MADQGQCNTAAVLTAWLNSRRTSYLSEGEVVWRLYGEGPVELDQLAVVSCDPKGGEALTWDDPEGVRVTLPAPTREVLEEALETRFSRVFPAMRVANSFGGSRSPKWILLMAPAAVLLDHAKRRIRKLSAVPVSPVEEGIETVGDSPLYRKWADADAT